MCPNDSVRIDEILGRVAGQVAGQCNGNNHHVGHADCVTVTFEISIDPSGEARRRIVKWQDLDIDEGGLELHYSVFTPHAPKSVDDFRHGYCRCRKPALIN